MTLAATHHASSALARLSEARRTLGAGAITAGGDGGVREACSALDIAVPVFRALLGYSLESEARDESIIAREQHAVAGHADAIKEMKCAQLVADRLRGEIKKNEHQIENLQSQHQRALSILINDQGERPAWALALIRVLEGKQEETTAA